MFDTLIARDEAQQICRSCPVRDVCLDRAMEVEKGWPVRHRHGIFGGLVPDERFELDRRLWGDTVPVGKPKDIVVRSGVPA